MTDTEKFLHKLPLRSEVDDKYKWDLFGNFPSNQAWEIEYNALDSKLDTILRFKGHLHEGPETLIQLFDSIEKLNTSIHLLSNHAAVFFAQDSTDNTAIAMRSRISIKQTDLSTKQSWINPEILSIPEEKLEEYRQYPGMRPYLHTFEMILRYKPHTLSAAEEAILSAAEDALDSSSNTFYQMTTADLTFGTIQNEDGELVELSEHSYSKYLESRDRRVRRKAFEQLFNVYISHKNSICSMLDGHIKAEIFRARAKHFSSCLEDSLFGENIPTSVYLSLLDTVHKYIPVFHKFLSIRQRVLKIPSLQPYDLYVPLVRSIDITVPYETACEWVLSSLQPLGDEYCRIARDAICGEGRWVDVFPNKGKRGGACSFVNWGPKAYLLINYAGNLDSVFTLAHELGHSMHTYFSRNAQPFRYFEYSTAVSEVASTVNEILLANYLIQKAKKENNRPLLAYLINDRCNFFKTTLFRQVQFAEFELKLHTMAEEGKPLTPESMSKLYKELNDFYYGDRAAYPEHTSDSDSSSPPPAAASSTEDSSAHKIIPASAPPSLPHVLQADPRISFEFLRIPHFFYHFYVYMYATSQAVAEAIVPRILSGDKTALDKYFILLKAGCSKYPLDILAEVGCDIRTPQPYEAALDIFVQLVTQLGSFL